MDRKRKLLEKAKKVKPDPNNLEKLKFLKRHLLVFLKSIRKHEKYFILDFK